MSINYSTLQGLTIPEGVVTQITDASGRVIWAVQSDNSEPIILEVEKITSNTYAAETAYNGEQFILLDIYPKTNGTVSVTYGGLTKTITDTSGAAEPNAQQVFFGTFNGVSDEVETPVSGELIIEGEFYAFGCGSFQNGSKATQTGYCGCVTAIMDLGNLTDIYANAFRENSKLMVQVLPEGITAIGDYAFAMRASSASIAGSSKYNLTWSTVMEGGEIVLPSTIKSIGAHAFASSNGIIASSGEIADSYPCYLAKVKMLATTPPTLGECAFGELVGLGIGQTFEVPKGCAEAYKAADGWSDYAYYIVEAE